MCISGEPYNIKKKMTDYIILEYRFICLWFSVTHLGTFWSWLEMKMKFCGFQNCLPRLQLVLWVICSPKGKRRKKKKLHKLMKVLHWIQQRQCFMVPSPKHGPKHAAFDLGVFLIRNTPLEMYLIMWDIITFPYAPLRCKCVFMQNFTWDVYCHSRMYVI